MAFVRKKVASYKWPVTIESPSQEGIGTFEIQEFEGLFERLGRSKISKLADAGDAQLIEAVLMGWSDIKEEDGTEISFSSKTRKEFLDDPYWCRGVVMSYLDSLEGASAKN